MVSKYILVYDNTPILQNEPYLQKSIGGNHNLAWTTLGY